MLDLNTQLGRDVATAKHVLEVIRPEMRMARAFRTGLTDGMRDTTLDHDDDLNLIDGGDQAAEQAVLAALVEHALKSVGEWAADMRLVFDKERTREFIRQAMIAAEAGGDALPSDALDY